MIPESTIIQQPAGIHLTTVAAGGGNQQPPSLLSPILSSAKGNYCTPSRGPAQLFPGNKQLQLRQGGLILGRIDLKDGCRAQKQPTL